MRKATLKHVEGQYILIVDERPIKNKYYYDFEFDCIARLIVYTGIMDSDMWRIIAAENLEGVKGIGIEHNNNLFQSKFKRVYEILNNKEVEVEEYEDYYLVKL